MGILVLFQFVILPISSFPVYFCFEFCSSYTFFFSDHFVKGCFPI